MKIANIYPIANQTLYRDESYVMILAHLAKRNLYKPENFKLHGQYVIMDNGLYEKEQVSTKLIDCIDIAQRSRIPVSEIIIPDVVNDSVETIKLFLDNIHTIQNYSDLYKFMFVAQANNEEELLEMIQFINRQPYNLSVGISKLCPFDRASTAAIEAYKQCIHPIHILGIKSSFSELNKLNSVTQIRGCDTSQLAFMAKNHVILPTSESVHNYERDGEDIDLAVDCCDLSTLIKLKNAETESLRSHGFL